MRCPARFPAGHSFDYVSASLDFKAADISKTSVCPLARVMRRRLRDRGIEHLPVVYSEEKPVPREDVLGTLSYVPGSAGLTLAGYVIKKIALEEDR